MRLASTSDRAVHVLFLRTEDSALELEKLSFLAFEARATEVLYWLVKGKTNEEMGIILGMPTGTVKAHLKNIFSHLQVENRATAASMISELLRVHLEKCCLYRTTRSGRNAEWLPISLRSD
jgi:DNA-binding NarL/FixJ family response regulator